MSRYPWRHNTSEDIANQRPSQWETPAGAQEKADQAEQNAKDYTDAHSEAGAEVNQNAYSVVNGIQATAKTDSIEIEAGTGIIVTPVPAEKKVRITAGGTSIPGLHGVEHNHDGADPIPELIALQEDVGDIAAQLADLKQLMIASWHGVDSSIGSADATDALNALFATAKAAGKRYVYFDEAHTFSVNGKLSEARDLILLGLAKIKSPIKENFLIKIHSTQSSPANVRVNSCSNISKTFAQLYRALLENRNVKVAVIGDSISVGGSHQLGVNYTTGGSGTVVSPGGITPADAYTQKLLNELVTTFKDNTFDFYNFAIGGNAINQWNTNQTFNGVTKPWVDHVKDVNPDLLVIAFGMNVSYETSASFRSDFDNFMDYVEANFLPEPSTIIVTTPRPVNSITDQWGTAESQFARINTANAARRRGYKRDCYIMDVGRCSDLVRVGIDWDQMSTYAEAVTDLDFDDAVTSTVTRVNGEYSLSAAGGTIETKRIYRDFTLEFDCAFQGTFIPNTSNLSIFYNNTNIFAKTNITLIIPVINSGGSVSWNFSRYANASENGVTATWIGSSPLNDNVFRKYRLQKRGNLVELYVDNVRMWAERIETWDVPGTLRLEKPDGSGMIRLKNLKLYRVEYTDFVPSITEYEMYGQHVDGEYSDKPFIGGNGVNHPAAPGLANTYERCIKELVRDLVAVDVDDKGTFIPTKISGVWQAIDPDIGASGVYIRFLNVPLTRYPKQVALQFSDESYLVHRPDCNSFSECIAKLQNRQFAAYISGGVTQIVVGITNLSDLPNISRFYCWVG